MSKFELIAAAIALGVASLTCAAVESSPKCKDQDGQDVDWFIVYKLPRMQPHKGNFMRPEGGEFVYVDARNSKESLRWWPLSSQDLFEPDNPVAFTLAPLYENTTGKDVLYFVYNDQSPEYYNGTRNGHSKGVVLFDESSGVWLLHSVPRFVDGLRSGHYSFPENARENAQMLMCITFGTSQVDTIARILRTEYANVYAKQVPESMKNRYPQVALLSKDSFVRGHDRKKFIANLTSAGGVNVRAYAKRATLGEDLYSSMLANDLQDDLVVQSWRNGAGGKLSADCDSKYTVTHVDSVRLAFDELRSITFNTTEDHSKWAIAIDKPIFCFASMNRMESQESRGGEAVCMENSAIHALFRRSAIVNTECLT